MEENFFWGCGLVKDRHLVEKFQWRFLLLAFFPKI